MWQTKYASAVPKNLGVGVNFRPRLFPLWASVVRDENHKLELYSTISDYLDNTGPFGSLGGAQ